LKENLKMSRITYKTALEWIIKHEDMKWIKEEKPVAPTLVRFVSEIYRVDVPKIVRTLRKDMGLDKEEVVAKPAKAPKAAKPAKGAAKAAKAPAKAGKPAKAAKAPSKKPNKSDRQAKLKTAQAIAAETPAVVLPADQGLPPIQKTPMAGEADNAAEA
jgi:hypothetical protein